VAAAAKEAVEEAEAVEEGAGEVKTGVVSSSTTERARALERSGVWGARMLRPAVPRGTKAARKGSSALAAPALGGGTDKESV